MRRSFLAALGLSMGALGAGAATAPDVSAQLETFDVVITTARVIDGTGTPARPASFGIKAGKIARIGTAWRISCTGCGESSPLVEFRWQALEQTVPCRCE